MKSKLVASIVSIGLSLLLLHQTVEAKPDKPVPPRIASLVAHLIKEAQAPDSHSSGDVYLLVELGSTGYIAELSSGKVVRQRKAEADGAGMCGIYAKVSVNLMNSQMKETAQGGGQVLKQTAGKWQKVASSEGDYSCGSLKRIPKTVRRCLKLECE
jgi:hypothetical protein